MHLTLLNLNSTTVRCLLPYQNRDRSGSAQAQTRYERSEDRTHTIRCTSSQGTFKQLATTPISISHISSHSRSTITSRVLERVIARSKSINRILFLALGLGMGRRPFPESASDFKYGFDRKSQCFGSGSI